LTTSSGNYSFQPQIDPKRIIAIWGFSEAALGGILHALKIPLTGMFVGGAAVIFITLLAHYSQKKTTILNAAVTVIVIKAIISPHTPLAAYFAVGLQGLLGYLFFSLVKFQKLAAILLGFFSLLFSSLQKFIILTIVFGNTFWNSIDDFANYILIQLKIDPSYYSLSFSIVLISIYAIIHVSVGIYLALKAVSLPKKVNEKSYSLAEAFKYYLTDDIFERKESKKPKRWWKRKSGIILIIFFTLLMILTYFEPGFEKNRTYEILIMLVRSFIITFIWFVIISPFLVSKFNKFIEKNKFERASEINRATALFPEFKKIINYSWKASANYRNIRRIRKFLSDAIVLLLITKINTNERNINL
jgi:hypothetical protein